MTAVRMGMLGVVAVSVIATVPPSLAAGPDAVVSSSIEYSRTQAAGGVPAVSLNRNGPAADATSIRDYIWTQPEEPRIPGVPTRGVVGADYALTVDGRFQVALVTGSKADEYEAAIAVGRVAANGTVQWSESDTSVFSRQFPLILRPRVVASTGGPLVAAWMSLDSSGDPRIALVRGVPVGTGVIWSSVSIVPGAPTVDCGDCSYVVNLNASGDQVVIGYSTRRNTSEFAVGQWRQDSWSWSSASASPERVALTREGSNVVVSADGSTIHAVIGDPFGGGRFARVTSGRVTPTGIEWRNPQTLATALQVNGMTVITSANGSRVLLAWSATTGDGNFVRARLSTDGGETWQEEVTVVGRSRFYQGFTMSMDSGGERALLAALRRDTTEDRIAIQAVDLRITPGTTLVDQTLLVSEWIPFSGDVELPLGWPQVSLAPDGERAVVAWSKRIRPQTEITAATILVGATISVGGSQSWTVTSSGVADVVDFAGGSDVALLEIDFYGSEATKRGSSIGRWAPRAVPPKAPREVTAAPGDRSAIVSWEAPASDGGSPVTGYTVTSSPGGRSCVTSGELSCTVTGLSNGTAYTFSVTASNAAGSSVPSAPSAAVTPRAPVVAPGAVGNLKATPAKGHLRVTWSAPPGSGGAASVTYQYRVGRGGWTSTSATSVKVPGRKGVRLTVQVRAVNEAGPGRAVSVSAAPR